MTKLITPCSDTVPFRKAVHCVGIVTFLMLCRMRKGFLAAALLTAAGVGDAQTGKFVALRLLSICKTHPSQSRRNQNRAVLRTTPASRRSTPVNLISTVSMVSFRGALLFVDPICSLMKATSYVRGLKTFRLAQ